jgi:hypothetical protein
MNKLYKGEVAMKKVIAAVLLGGSIFLSNLVLAEDLTIYLKETAIKKFDLGEKGSGVSDLITRSGNLFFKLDGPAVGTYYQKATVTHIDNNNMNMREVLVEFNLPEGEILTMDYVKVEQGKVAGKGFKHRGVVLGGTGIYSGIRGSYDHSWQSDKDSTFLLRIQK